MAAFGSAASLFMGASAAANQTRDVIERGGTNSQALLGGLAAGAAETIFEKFSIDRLLNIRDVKSAKELLGVLCKQAGVEASEEMFTEISNILSDAAIMGKSSNFNLAVEQYQGQGLSLEEAKKRAYLDCIGQVAWAGVGGALSGFAMGGGKALPSLVGNTASRMQTNAQTNAVNRSIDGAYASMQENGGFSPEARAARGEANQRLGLPTRRTTLLSSLPMRPTQEQDATQTVAQEPTAQAQKAASTGEAGTYRAVTPENVELPTVPIINLSMRDVAAHNDGVLPQTGNALRKQAISRARTRLGLDKKSAAYIPASNVMRNGEEYVLKITKASLNKMLSPSVGDVIPAESIVVLDNLERIANNGVYFKSEGDRQSRDQIAGYDHLMTTVYIDGQPYSVDMRVRVYDTQAGGENRLYYFTPEEIVAIKEVDTDPPTGERHAFTIPSEGVSTSSDTTIPKPGPGVNTQSAQLSGKNMQEGGQSGSDVARLIEEGWREPGALEEVGGASIEQLQKERQQGTIVSDTPMLTGGMQDAQDRLGEEAGAVAEGRGDSRKLSGSVSQSDGRRMAGLQREAQEGGPREAGHPGGAQQDLVLKEQRTDGQPDPSKGRVSVPETEDAFRQRMEALSLRDGKKRSVFEAHRLKQDGKGPIWVAVVETSSLPEETPARETADGLKADGIPYVISNGEIVSNWNGARNFVQNFRQASGFPAGILADFKGKPRSMAEFFVKRTGVGTFQIHPMAD